MSNLQRIRLGSTVLTLIASGSLLVAGDQLRINGKESGHIFINPTTVDGQSMLLTDDCADGVGTHLGRYKLLARELISVDTGAVSQGAFIIIAANGDTISGTYDGQATFEPSGASWVAEGPVAGGTGRFEGATGTFTFRGRSDFSTCQSVGALSTCEFTEDTSGTITLPDHDGSP